MKTLKFVFVFAFMALMYGFVWQPKPWDVPAEFKSKQNPVKKTDKVMAEGKTHYNQVCAGCHGPTGKGDGVKVKDLANIRPASLTETMNKFKDGEHFFIIKYGRGQSHSFSGKIDDEGIWATIHYMKTLTGK